MPQSAQSVTARRKRGRRRSRNALGLKETAQAEVAARRIKNQGRTMSEGHLPPRATSRPRLTAFLSPPPRLQTLPPSAISGSSAVSVCRQSGAVKISASIRGRCCQRTTLLNTSLKNPPEPDEIEVVDPAHPLFGRKFRLVSRPRPSPTGPDFVLVAYRDSMLLKLAVLATNLTSVPLSTARTKFTVQALEELLSLVKECESPCCPIPSISGVSCQKRSGKKSSRTSSPSSRR